MNKNLLISIIEKDLNKVKSLITENRLDLNAKDDEGDTVLMYACSVSNLDVVKYLVTEGCLDINVKNNDGITALMLACVSGKFDIVKYLVSECNANVNAKDNDGVTALMGLCGDDKNLELVKYLVAEGKAEVNVFNKKGITALTIASKEAHKIAQYLIREAGADLELKDENGNELPFYKYLTSFIVRLYF
jgi:ankyrin repeat protein